MGGEQHRTRVWPAVLAIGLVFVGAVAGVAYAITRELSDSYDREIRRVAVQRAQLANELSSALLPLTRETMRRGLTAQQLAALSSALERLQKLQPLLGVAIFDRKRQLVYPAAPGLSLQVPEGIARALTGSPAAERHAEADDPYVEASVPIRDRDGSVIGAVALQLDEDRLESEIAHDYDRAFIALVGAAVIAWLLLLPVSLRVARLAAPYFSTRRWRARRGMRHALKAGEIEVHYQPKVSLPGCAPCGAEGLVRWRRNGQLVSPIEFVPYIEETDLVHDLTAFVLDRAVADAAAWRRAGYDLGVAINLAPRSFSDDSLPGRVEATLAQHGLPAAALTLEVTEKSVLEDQPRVGEILDRLAQIGVSISVDDFGTGHSSLARLERFPIDEIKIDRWFVAQMTSDERHFVDAMVTLAKAVGIDVVAEGVEDKATLDLLIASGCGAAQGFLFCRPIPLDQFTEWLAAHSGAAVP